MIQRYISIKYQKDVALQLLSLDHTDLPSRSRTPSCGAENQATVKLGWSSSLEVKLKVLTWKDLTLRNPLTGSNRKLIKKTIENDVDNKPTRSWGKRHLRLELLPSFLVSSLGPLHLSPIARRSSAKTSGNNLGFVTLFMYIWLYMTIYVVYDYKWLIMIIYDYICYMWLYC